MFVEDINDNAPVIRVNALTEAGDAEIDENLPAGSFVAHVSVADHDTGSSGQVNTQHLARESYSRCEMYCRHPRLCVCASVRGRM